MAKRHYYRYKGFYPFAASSEEADIFWKHEGIIIKCYTEEEVNRWYKNSREVWERVEKWE